MSDTTTSDAPPLAEQAKQQAHQAVEQGKQAVQQGKEMAGGLLDKARGQVKTQIGTQKDNAATSLNDVAQALLLSSNHLQEQGQGNVAHLTDVAAERITKLSGYLRERDVDDVLNEATTFARSQPALFLGTAVLLGLAAARFLKSSGQADTSSASGNGSNALLPVPVGAAYDNDAYGTVQSAPSSSGYAESGSGLSTATGRYPEDPLDDPDRVVRTSDAT